MRNVLNTRQQQTLQVLQAVSSAAIAGRKIVYLSENDLSAENLWGCVLRCTEKLSEYYGIKCKISKHQITFNTGGEVTVRTADQQIKMANGSTIHVVGTDEDGPLVGMNSSLIISDDVEDK